MKNEEQRAATEAEREQAERREAVQRETAGMHTAFIALQGLDYGARRRALRWLSEALDDAEPPF